MPESISFYTFGGINAADEPLSLLQRSHRRTDGGWEQYAPAEASSAKNVTFDQRALAKRIGSTLIDDSSSVHAASETILGGFAVGAEQWLVGAKSLYRKASGGSWAIAQASGGGNFAWDSTVAVWSACYLDGYVFVGTDGANNEIACVNPGSVTLRPEMKNANTYTEQYSGTNTMTGTWPTGCKIVVAFQGRLCMCTGDSIVQFTDVDQPWDLAGGGFWQFHGDTVALKTFIPRGQNELLERLFGFTVNGLQILSGFDGNDTPFRMEGVGVPLSHRSVEAIQNWLVYPTEQQTIEAVNLYRVIDLGRRMLNGDGTTGPLDNLSPGNSTHRTKGFSFYDRRKKQWRYYGPDGASRSYNTMAWGMDFQLEEPGLDEGQNAFEQHVRPLWDTLTVPGTNPWFVGIYQAINTIVGVTADGKTYTVNSGLNDKDSLAIEDNWDTPEIYGAPPDHGMHFMKQSVRTDDRGDWELDVQYAKEGDPSFTDLYSFTQAAQGSAFIGSAIVGTSALGDGGRAKGTVDVDVHGETIRFRFKNQRVSEDWRVGLFVQQFQLEAEQR